MNANANLLRRNFFSKRIPMYRSDPVLFAREVLRFEPDSWQIDSLMDLARNPKVAIKSGQGVGKTGIEAVALLWFLTCFPYPRIVATAPTKKQLHDVLWSEVAKWQERSPLLKAILKWTKTYIYMIGYEKRWFATARTATKPENMQGFHEDNMLFIIDEASGVAEPIMEAILGTLSGGNNKLLMCGNPTRTVGAFFDAFHTDRELYSCHTISSEDSPRADKQHIQSLIKKYGYESNVVRVRIRGLFPQDEDDVYITMAIVSGSQMCDPEPEQKISLGIDVARYGSDETVISECVFSIARIYKTYRGKSLMWTTGEVLERAETLHTRYPDVPHIVVNIDDTGLGGGVTDRLQEIVDERGLGWLIVNPVNAAAKVPEVRRDDDDKEEVEVIAAPADMTAYMWKNMRDMMEEKRVQMDKDDELAGQMSTRKYSITSNGKIKLESKEDMKKRGFDSPDRADSIALALYPATIPVSIPTGLDLGKSSYWRS